MSTHWPDDAQLDALMASAENTRSKAVRFDPETPGGFRALTEQEDRDLIDAIALPQQRHDADREHLTREREQAERVGDRDGVDTADAHLEALDDEHDRDQRTDPRLPTRAEIDAIYEKGDREGWTEQSARAVEYLDLRRDIADEREAAEQAGDAQQVAYLDRQREQVDRNHSHWLGEPEERPTHAGLRSNDELAAARAGQARQERERPRSRIEHDFTVDRFVRDRDDEELER